MRQFTDGRDRLELALGSVPGVHGYRARPSVLSIGDAWPLIGPSVRGPGDSFEVTWRVLVYLGGDADAATAWMDDHLPQLVEAIDPVAYVDGFEPSTVPIDGNDAFVIELTTRSE